MIGVFLLWISTVNIITVMVDSEKAQVFYSCIVAFGGYGGSSFKDSYQPEGRLVADPSKA